MLLLRNFPKILVTKIYKQSLKRFNFNLGVGKQNFLRPFKIKQTTDAIDILKRKLP